MTVNIYDTANKMEQELRLTNEYQNLKQSFEKVQQDENASALYRSFKIFKVRFNKNK